MTDFFAVSQRSPLVLRPALTANHSQARFYRPPPGMREAMDVAMMLGEPLVLTGAPGAGKTQAAVWLTQDLGAGEMLRYDVKSTTLGADLLYSFDDVGRFRDAAANNLKPLIHYLRFNALGEGILRAAGGQAVLKTLSGEVLKGRALDRNSQMLSDAFGPDWTPIDGLVLAGHLLPREPAFLEAEREARVVLIDELDKAPRDTPNDLLAEVEHMTFSIPELGLKVQTDRAVRPVVIITSNSEKPLPEPFLRRCAFFNVPRVQGRELEAILNGSVSQLTNPGLFVREAAQVMDVLHADQNEIQRRPGTAELLAWMEVLVAVGGLRDDSSIKSWVRSHADTLKVSLGALLKHAGDQAAGQEIISQWASERSRPADA